MRTPGRRASPGRFLLLLALAAACRGSGPVEERNLLLIVVDTLRQDRVHAYGYERETTPHLDRLAREGALVDAVSPAAWTKPATVSVLTGLHPIRHNTISRRDALAERATTLAERLAERGYGTGAVAANAWISRDAGLAQGFDSFVERGDLPEGGSPGELVNEAAIALLDRLVPPFFLYVHYVDPHDPYAPRVDAAGRPLEPRLAARAPMRLHELSPLSEGTRDPELVAIASELYDGEVRTVDARIGELLAALDARGLGETTLTLVTSDHGEEFEDHGRLGHGHALYREVTDVPWILHAPGRIPGGQRLPRASLLDVVPTALDLLGHGPGTEVDVDGMSLAAALVSGDPDRVDRDRGFTAHLDIESGRAWAYEKNGKRVILGMEPYVKGYFDLDEDPREQEDRFADPESAATWTRLVRRLKWIHLELRQEGVLPRRSIDSLDDRRVDRLAALGYAWPGAEDDRRLLPVPADLPSPDPGWLRGLEDPARFGAVVDVGVVPSLQLLRGWHGPGRGEGRWTEPEATLALRVPDGTGELRFDLAGINHRPDRPTVRVTVDGQPAGEVRVPRGRYELGTRVGPGIAPGTVVRVDLRVDPPYEPWRHGSPDRRTLGLHVERVALERRLPAP